MENEHIKTLVKMYLEIGIPLDQLPHTREMEQLGTLLRIAEGKGFTLKEIWHDLVGLRKKGALPRLRR